MGHTSMASKKMVNFAISQPLHPQKRTVNQIVLFKNNRIRKHVTNFKTQSPPLTLLPRERHKSMVPKINVKE